MMWLLASSVGSIDLQKGPTLHLLKVDLTQGLGRLGWGQLTPGDVVSTLAMELQL